MSTIRTNRIMHRAWPGPEGWDHACTRCSEDVRDHASLMRLLIFRVFGK